MWTAHKAAWKNGGGGFIKSVLYHQNTICEQRTISMMTQWLHLLYVAKEIGEEKEDEEVEEEELTFFFM